MSYIHDTINFIDRADLTSEPQNLEAEFSREDFVLETPDSQITNLFIQTLSPIINDRMERNLRVNNIVSNLARGIPPSTNELLEIQKVEAKISTNLSVISKLTSLGIKFVNEITHIQ